MRSHATQTNEPGRCATLLPVLARLPQPLALIEVGASAGLCLLPDLYGYDFGRRSLQPEDGPLPRPVFTCSVSEETPIPSKLPRIVWRAGLDLNPVDVADPSQAAWLETLVWPERVGRLDRLRACVRLALANKPRLVKGDLRGDDLDRLCQEAPRNATLVIFHTAVLAYVADQAERQAFAQRAGALCDYWICNESPWVFPEAAERARVDGPPGWFLLSVNGLPVAWSDPHGAGLDWIADAPWPGSR